MRRATIDSRTLLEYESGEGRGKGKWERRRGSAHFLSLPEDVVKPRLFYREQYKEGDEEADSGNDGKTTSKSGLALNGIYNYGEPRGVEEAGCFFLRRTLDGDACCPHEGGCPPQLLQVAIEVVPQ